MTFQTWLQKCSAVKSSAAFNATSYGYQSRGVLGRLRAHRPLLNTESHRLLDRGKVACRFDELTIDTARNRFVEQRWRKFPK